MKKKVYAMIKSVLLVLFLSCCFFACNTVNSSTEQVEFKNFNVETTATAELKSYYVFEKPEVTVGEEKANVNVRVVYDGESVPNNGARVYLEHTGKYSIYYTATYKDSFESKSTELTVSDTVAPVIVLDIPKYVDYGTVLTLKDYCKAIDATDVESVTYSVEDAETETALAESQFDAVNGVLKVTDTTVSKVAITATATDVNGYVRSQTAETQFLVPDAVGMVGVEHIDCFGEAVGEKTLASDEQLGEVVAWKVSVPKSTMYTYWVSRDDFVDYGDYDYIDYKIKVVPDEGNESTNVLVYPNNVEYAECTNGNVFGVAGAAEWTTVSFAKTGNKGEKTFAAFETGKLGLSLKNNNLNHTLSFTVYIAEISCRYTDMFCDNTAIDLTKKYEGVKSASFTPLGATQAQAIDDMTAWTPATGVLSFVVSKANQAERTFAINAVVTEKNKVACVSATNIYINGTAAGEKALTLDEQHGTVVAWKVSVPKATMYTYYVDCGEFVDYGGYDYIDYKIKVVPDAGNESTNVLVYPNNVEYAECTNGNVFGVAGAAEWTTVSFAKTGNKGEKTFAAFETGKIGLSLKNNHLNHTLSFTVYIAEISCRYEDVEAKGTAIDLTAKYAGIKSATITPTGSTQAQAIDDLTAWTPVDGTLFFTVAKDGCLNNSYTLNVTIADPVGTLSARTIASKGTTSVSGVDAKNTSVTLEDDATYGKVVVWETAIAGNSWAHLTITNESYADFANYDYIDFVIKVVRKNEITPNVLIYPNKIDYANENTTNNVFGISKATEWTTVTFAKTCNKGTAIFNAFASDNAVTLSLKNNNDYTGDYTTRQELTVYIAKISVR